MLPGPDTADLEGRLFVRRSRQPDGRRGRPRRARAGRAGGSGGGCDQWCESPSYVSPSRALRFAGHSTRACSH